MTDETRADDVDIETQEDQDSARALTQAVNNLTRVVTNLDELLRRDYPKRAEIERRFQTRQSARKLMVQGLVLILVCAGLAAYFNVQLADQQSCFEKRLEQSSTVQSKRADLNEQESAQERALWSIYAEAAGLIKGSGSDDLSEEDQTRLNAELVDQLLEYQRVVGGNGVKGEIQKKREKLPVKPYEPGSC